MLSVRVALAAGLLFPMQAECLAQGKTPTASQVPLVSTERLPAMRAAVEHYRRIVAAGGWPSVGKGRHLRAGEADERVTRVRRRLTIEGILSPSHGGSVFDPGLEDENSRLKRIVADLSLDKEMLQDIVRRKI